MMNKVYDTSKLITSLPNMFTRAQYEQARSTIFTNAYSFEQARKLDFFAPCAYEEHYVQDIDGYPVKAYRYIYTSRRIESESYIVITEILTDTTIERWYYATFNDKHSANECALALGNNLREGIYHAVIRATDANAYKVKNLPIF